MPVVLEAATLSGLLTDIGSVVTAAITWCGSVVTFITSQPLVFLYAGAIPLVGLGVSLLRRMTNRL